MWVQKIFVEALTISLIRQNKTPVEQTADFFVNEKLAFPTGKEDY